MFVDLIIVTILNITCFFKVSNKHFKYATYNRNVMGKITLDNYTVSTCNFFVITIHYVNAVLTHTVYVMGVLMGLNNIC